MRWSFRHPKHGTCIPSCRTWSMCHCGCGAKTNIVWKTDSKLNKVAKRPFVFLAHHYRPTQWKPSRPAKCHPDRSNHSMGWCSACFWKRWKRGTRDYEAVNDWERKRYHRFQELVAEGMEIHQAVRQLERDVPSEMEEAVP